MGRAQQGTGPAGQCCHHGVTRLESNRRLPDCVVAERHSQCWGLVVLNRIRRREGCGTIRDETMVRFNHAEPIAGPRDTYTIDREQDLPFADVPTGGRRINYFQIGGGA